MKLLMTSLASFAFLTGASIAYAQNPGADSPGQDQRPRSVIQDHSEGSTGNAPTRSETTGAGPARSAPGAVSPNPAGALGGRIPGRTNPDRVSPAPGENGPPD
jgi:hypothetical protein